MERRQRRGIRSALGGTVNDVMLTLLGGALGSYLRAHGVNTNGVTVRMQIPVNVRSADQKGALGNRVSMLVAPLPVGIFDPLERLRQVRTATAQLKERGQASRMTRMLDLLELLPPVLQRPLGDHAEESGQTQVGDHDHHAE